MRWLHRKQERGPRRADLVWGQRQQQGLGTQLLLLLPFPKLQPKHQHHDPQTDRYTLE